jgi:hypothetical protein
MQHDSSILSQFSKHLFWDIDSSELDINAHTKYIISKVIQYGNYTDWKLLVKCYGINLIVKNAQKIRELDKRTASFLAIIGEVPKASFLCYSTKPSTPKHWGF